MKIVSTILSFVLTSTILVNSLGVSFTYGYYYLDTSGFIERLCVNKDKPAMQCNGKCHLKKVVENNTNDDKEPFKGFNFKEILLYVVEPTKYEFVNSSFIKVQKINYDNLYNFSISKGLDRPPQV
ncbi:MAG: hypothetical protein K9I95_12450 [Flavobacteriaceae bacterium]|nr:hypothetical protein [Flavobacteriaceae bacterium]